MRDHHSGPQIHSQCVPQLSSRAQCQSCAGCQELYIRAPILRTRCNLLDQRDRTQGLDPDYTCNGGQSYRKPQPRQPWRCLMSSVLHCRVQRPLPSPGRLVRMQFNDGPETHTYEFEHSFMKLPLVYNHRSTACMLPGARGEREVLERC